jgi:N-dimethylarginine dimethylaminohydrolase
MRLFSQDEWSPLRAVIVGTVEGFCPGIDAEVAHMGKLDEAANVAQQAFPRWYLDEVAEDLHDFCQLLTRAHVEVMRPEWKEASPRFCTPSWCASGFDIYNVRDLHVVVGNTLIESAPSSRFRLFESLAFRDVLLKRFFDEGMRWVSAPPPRLANGFIREMTRPVTTLERAEDEAHQRLSRGLTERHHQLTEDEVIFDAANIMRLGRDLLVLVSSTANRKAVRWLSEIVAPEYRVHETHTYRSSHLDSTILPLREGLVLLNAARVEDETCPSVLRSWEKLYFGDMAPVPDEEIQFHREVRLPVHAQLAALGFESSLQHISSPWAGLNVFSLDSNTVCVHDRQAGLIRELERRRFTVIPVRMRHCYTMLGGLHCTTLDVVREA